MSTHPCVVVGKQIVGLTIHIDQRHNLYLIMIPVRCQLAYKLFALHICEFSGNQNGIDFFSCLAV